MMKNTQFQALFVTTLFLAAFLLLPTIHAGDDRTKSVEISFNKDVAPILFKHCADCHRPGEAAPMSLLSYKDARPWAKSIREKVAARVMPPWHADPRYGEFKKDRSSVALIFAKEPPAKQHDTVSIYNAYFQIPRGDERHRVTACWTTQEDIQIKALMPHMHLRGAAMEVRAFYPDGRSAILLNVPRYDFNWQTNYSLKQPLSVPKGTRLFITGVFDNSAKNKYNPDPSQLVRHGEPTYDEMLFCFLDYIRDVKQIAPPISGQSSTQR